MRVPNIVNAATFYAFNDLKKEQQRAIIVSLLSLLATVIASFISAFRAGDFQVATPVIALSSSLTALFITDRLNVYIFQNRLEKDLRVKDLEKKNLVYLGDNKDGVDWLVGNLYGAQIVRNTVLTRSALARSSSIRTRFAALNEEITKVIEAGCSWRDVWAESEKAQIAEFRQGLTEAGRRLHETYKIETDLPLFQCITIDKDKSKHVLVGWNFPGFTRSRVYLSEDQDTFDYFNEYLERLTLKKDDPSVWGSSPAPTPG